MVWIALHGVLFLFLFSDFYKVRYTNEKAVKNSGACMVRILKLIIECVALNVVHFFVILLTRKFA